MKRVLTTLPLPHRLAEAHGLRTVPVRLALQQTAAPHVLVERGERLLGVRNAPATVKAAAGVAELRGFRHALVPTVGDLVDYGAAWTALHPHLQLHSLPLYPGDVRRTERAVTAVLRELEEPSDEGNSPVDSALLARVLREQEGDQLAGRYPSPDWRRFLASLAAGTLLPLPEEAPPDRRVPVALLGYLAGPSDLLDYVEIFGGRVIFDEWLHHAARLCLAAEPAEALANSPLVRGLEARFEALEPLLERVDAVILVVEPFCAHALEEAFFRTRIRKPLLVIEGESLGHLDATRLMRLENFAGVALGYSGGGRT